MCVLSTDWLRQQETLKTWMETGSVCFLGYTYWMHKSQTRTLELKLPMERQLRAVLMLCWTPAKDSARRWWTFSAVLHSAVWGGACPTVVHLGSPAPREHPGSASSTRFLAFSSSHLVET